MRRAHDIGQAEQRVLRRRFLDEDVESGARHLPRFERLAQCRLVHQPAARAIDDAHALLHFRERRGVDDVARLVGERRVQRDEIGTLEQFVEPHLFDAQIRRPALGQKRIIGDHLHLQPKRALGDDRADIAAADDAQRLGENLHTHEPVLFPLAGARGGIGFGDLPRQRQHQRDRVLGGGDGIAERRVHDDDAARGRRRYVDIIDADAGTADDFQALGIFQDFRRHLGGRTDGEAVVIADRGGEFFLVLAEIGLEIDFDAAILEYLHGRGRQRVGNENFGGGHCFIQSVCIVSAVIVRGGGRSSNHSRLRENRSARDYWMPAFAGMTAR